MLLLCYSDSIKHEGATMVHKDGRFIWFQSKHITVLISLPIGRNWITGKRHEFAVNVYNA